MHQKLLLIQQEIGSIKKDSENPYYKSKYFDINSLLEVVKPILNKHGVILLQGLTSINGKMALETTLIEAAGALPHELNRVTYVCPLPDCADPQKYGSAITYFRRYSLQSLLALQAEDDDGNSVSAEKEPKEPVIEHDNPAPKKVSKTREFNI